MNDQAFDVLQYHELKEVCRRYAQTVVGKARISSLKPLAQLEALQTELKAVAEAVELRRQNVRWSFSGLIDPSESLGRLHIEGSTLDAMSLLGLARLAEQALTARSAVLSVRDVCPRLAEIVGELPPALEKIVSRITSKILPTGELDDRASPQLAELRQDIIRLRSRITRSLESLMRRADEAIQEELITLRNDRFVIPVKIEHRNQIKGVTHGVSSSGATVFIEPLETIDSNNELQDLREREEREIQKILFELTEEAREQLPSLRLAVKVIAELDFINAKAEFFREFDCTIPIISEIRRLELSEARHPLLEESFQGSDRKVVPVSLSLDEDRPVMIISGANAGGKTVVLKTAGLLSLMALSGLPVPARHATIPFYASVLADIGDHQSLAANLSTFTSHVSNISRMIAVCKAPALVLLDEVGTGTDPDEGSALGVAVVDHFRSVCGAQVMATTHYSGLKMYAANEEQVINASVEFDERTLQPTYRLLVGIAGSSSGLDIARRFGFPDTIISEAKDRVDTSALEAAAYLDRIKRETQAAEDLRRALEEERAAVADKYAALEVEAARREQNRQAQFEDELLTAMEHFDKRVADLLSRVEDEADRARVERVARRRAAELRKEKKQSARAASSGALTETPQRPVRVVREGRVINAQGLPSHRKAMRSGKERSVKVGDTVRSSTFESVGVIERIDGDTAELRSGSMRFKENILNLERVELDADRTLMERVAEHASRSTEIRRKPSSEIRTELNLIGRKTDEAVEETDKFLDDAFLNSVHSVRIIHGHGTGALRKAISDLLRDHPHVERFASAPADQGGSGATLVDLRS